MYDPLWIHESPGLTKKVLDSLRPFNAAVDELELREQSRAALEAQATDDLPSKTPQELRMTRDRLADEQFEIVQQSLALALERPPLCDQVIDSLEKKLSNLEKQLQKVREETADQLKKAGYGPESDPYFSANRQAVQRKFAHTVERAEPVRDALRAWHTHQAEIAKAREQKKQCPELEQQARAELEQAARAILNVKPPVKKPAPKKTNRAGQLLHV